MANTTLPNPTVLHLDIGTMYVDLKIGDLVIGNASLQDVTIVPGDNTVPLTGTIDVKSVIRNLSDVLKAESTSLGKGNLTLSAVTTSVVWNGTEVPYYTNVLCNLTMTTTVHIGDIFNNTMRYFKQHKDSTSSLSGEISSSSLASRSEDENWNRDPIDLALSVKQSSYIRDFFRDVDPRRRDDMIDSITAMYHESFLV